MDLIAAPYILNIQKFWEMKWLILSHKMTHVYPNLSGTIAATGTWTFMEDEFHGQTVTLIRLPIT